MEPIIKSRRGVWQPKPRNRLDHFVEAGARCWESLAILGPLVARPRATQPIGELHVDRDMRIMLTCIGAMLASVCAQAQVSVTAADRDEIQSLAAQYAKALGSCDAKAFADLFESESGFFASGFRGKVEGRERLVALVESERHCLAANPDGSRGRPGAANVPTVSLETNSAGFFGLIDLGAAGQYQDEYVRTPAGWRFASRTVVTPAEKSGRPRRAPNGGNS